MSIGTTLLNTTATTVAVSTTEIYFYKFLVTHQVFYKSKYTYALVNIKPLVPGHVLIVPLRTTVLRFGDLTPDESVDYMNTLQLIHKFIQRTYAADALNIAIQDGPESGQSVPHLHTHIIPRYSSDGYGDSIYTKLEKYDLEVLYQQFETRKKLYIELGSVNALSKKDEERSARSEEVMKKEADWLREEIERFLEDVD